MQWPNRIAWYWSPLKYSDKVQSSINVVDHNHNLGRDFRISKLGDNLGMIWVRKFGKLCFVVGRNLRYLRWRLLMCSGSIPTSLLGFIKVKLKSPEGFSFHELSAEIRSESVGRIQSQSETVTVQSQVTYCNINLGTSIRPYWSLNKNTWTITLKLTEKI